MIELSKEDLLELLNQHNLMLHQLHVDLAAAQAYIRLLEDTLRGMHPTELEDHFEHPARLH
jgi:hypothetical protein